MRLVVVFFFAGLAAGAVPTHAATDCRDVTPPTGTELAEDGPYSVGQTNFTFVDTSRPTPPNGTYAGTTASRTLGTVVWYPAQQDGTDTPRDTSGAPYPVVIHSHGLFASNVTEGYLARHLATRGYVVAAPNYPLSGGPLVGGSAPGGTTRADLPNQPGDWSFVLDRVLAEFNGMVDPARVGASGLSFGGLTTLLVTYHQDLRDPRIGAAFAMAPGGGCIFTRAFFETTPTPLLILNGDSDVLAPLRSNGKRSYLLAGRPKQLVTLRNGSHSGFSLALADGSACSFVGGLPYDPANPFPGLGGVEVGINPSRCRAPCSEPPPTPTSQMPLMTQHDLTETAAAAFFDAELRDDVAARCYLQRSFRREYSDYIRVRSRSAAQ